MEQRSLTYLKWGFLFLCLNINIRSFELLPDFVGFLLLFGSIQSHSRQTEAEKTLKPLLLILAADYFLHWILDFQNGIEALLALVISLYVLFVLIGEVAERIRPEQSEKASLLGHIRQLILVQQVIFFGITAYGNEVLNGVAVVVVLVTWIVLLVAVCGIRPVK